MGERYSIVDSWGNVVGEIPSGDFGDAFFLFLALMILWVVGFLIYAFFMLIIRGFQALGRGELLKAVAYLAIPLALSGAVGFHLLDNAVKVEALKEEFISNVAVTIKLTGVEGHIAGVVVANNSAFLIVNIPTCDGYNSVGPGATVEEDCLAWYSFHNTPTRECVRWHIRDAPGYIHYTDIDVCNRDVSEQQ